MFNNSLFNPIIKNASWLIFGRIFTMVISLFVGMLTARYLGPMNYGLLSYAGAYVAFFVTFCTLGINNVIVKEFVDNPSNEGTIIGTTLFLRGLSSLFSAIIIIAVVSIVDYNEPVTIIVVALSSIGMIFSIFDVFNFWFQSRLESKFTALLTVISYCSTAVYKIYLLVNGASVALFALSSSIDYVVLGIGLLIAYRKSTNSALSVSFSYAKSLLKKSAPFILPGLMVSIYGQTDRFMLKQMISESEIAYFSSAVTIANLGNFVIASIIDSMIPGIMTSKQNSEHEFVKKNKLLYSIVFYISIAISLFISIFAELIVLLLFGSEFAPASGPLRIVTWYTAFSYLGVARNTWIVCNKKQNKIIYIYVFSALANVALNILFIPTFGASGAAFASLTTQISTVFVLPLFIADYRENVKMMFDAIILRDYRNKR